MFTTTASVGIRGYRRTSSHILLIVKTGISQPSDKKVRRTGRGKDADVFWFSLFHELAHIVLGHVGRFSSTTEKDEDDADKWSRDILIAPPDFQQFKNDKDYSERSVVRFARDLGIAPGIVVGRMQREGMIKYSMLNDLKEKYEIAI